MTMYKASYGIVADRNKRSRNYEWYYIHLMPKQLATTLLPMIMLKVLDVWVRASGTSWSNTIYT